MSGPCGVLQARRPPTPEGPRPPAVAHHIAPTGRVSPVEPASRPSTSAVARHRIINITDKRKRQQLWGSMGGLTAWSRHDVETMLGAARRGFIARFEELSIPTGDLSQEERSRCAQRAMRAHMLQLAERSANVRGSNRRATSAGSSAKPAMEDADVCGDHRKPR